MNQVDFDFVVVGGGPSGATAANDLAVEGWRVLLLDREGRPKPCGGAIPPRLIKDFAIPDELLVAKIRCARMISPKDNKVDIPIEDGFVGMVDRQDFDQFLRDRAAASGAFRQQAVFEKVERDEVGGLWVYYTPVTGKPLEPGQTAQRVLLRASMRRSSCASGFFFGQQHGHSSRSAFLLLVDKPNERNFPYSGPNRNELVESSRQRQKNPGHRGAAWLRIQTAVMSLTPPAPK